MGHWDLGQWLFFSFNANQLQFVKYIIQPTSHAYEFQADQNPSQGILTDQEVVLTAHDHEEMHQTCVVAFLVAVGQSP